MGCTQPIQYENSTKRNSAIDKPTRKASARAILLSRPSPPRDFFSMNTPALAKAAMMPTRAKAISSFMSPLSHPVKGAAFTRLIVLLAAVAASAGTASLGFWQLDRARQKDSLQAAIQARSMQPALRAHELKDAQHHHRVALVEGRWKPQTLVFLENRPMNGQAGFIVLTALELPDGRAVLVQRGWQPRDLRDRTLTQPVPTPADTPVRLRARVAPPPSRLMDFQGAAQGTVRQNVDLTAYGQEFGLTLLPISLVQLEPALACNGAADSQAPIDSPCTDLVQDGLKRDWTVVGSSADKNRGYALQWFGLSALVAGLYVWFQWWLPWRQRRRARPGAETGPDTGADLSPAAGQTAPVEPQQQTPANR